MLFRFHKCNTIYKWLCFLISIVLILSGCSKVVPPKSSFKSRLSFQIENLLYVYTSGAVICKPLLAFSSNESLVLATDRLTYDQAEINQISAFINSQGVIAHGFEPTDYPPIPKTLEYITGSASLISVLGSSTAKEERDSTSCFTTLDVTNVSNMTIEIPQVYLRYISNAKPNTQLYRLINVCSIGIRTQISFCPPVIGSTGDGYEISVTIGMGSANTTYSGQISFHGEGPSIPTLRPGGSARIQLFINIKNYESGLFVSTTPEIVITSPEKTQTVALNQLKWDLAIAAPQNVLCYALKGNTFVQQTPMTVYKTPMTSPSQHQGGSWCV